MPTTEEDQNEISMQTRKVASLSQIPQERINAWADLTEEEEELTPEKLIGVNRRVEGHIKTSTKRDSRYYPPITNKRKSLAEKEAV